MTKKIHNRRAGTHNAVVCDEDTLTTAFNTCNVIVLPIRNTSPVTVIINRSTRTGVANYTICNRSIEPDKPIRVGDTSRTYYRGTP